MYYSEDQLKAVDFKNSEEDELDELALSAEDYGQVLYPNCGQLHYSAPAYRAYASPML
jgi:hypothetical protein